MTFPCDMVDNGHRTGSHGHGGHGNYGHGHGGHGHGGHDMVDIDMVDMDMVDMDQGSGSFPFLVLFSSAPTHTPPKPRNPSHSWIQRQCLPSLFPIENSRTFLAQFDLVHTLIIVESQ